MAQRLVDNDSDLSNRGIPQSKAREGRVNFKDITTLKLNDLKACMEGVTCKNDSLSPEYTHLTSTPKNFKDVQINRFYNLHKNPQEPIFYDFAIDTVNEAKDNYVPPKILESKTAFPQEDTSQGQRQKCIPIPLRQL